MTENVYYNVPNQAAGELVPADLKTQFPQLDVTPGSWLRRVADRPRQDSTKYTDLITEVTASS